jgi:hypothetical protein
MERRLKLSDSYIGGGSGRPREADTSAAEETASYTRGGSAAREGGEFDRAQHNGSALGSASVAAGTRIRVSGPIAARARRQGPGATSARALAASFGGGDLVGSSRWDGGSCC